MKLLANFIVFACRLYSKKLYRWNCNDYLIYKEEGSL
jgi:hypothetical protein